MKILVIALPLLLVAVLLAAMLVEPKAATTKQRVDIPLSSLLPKS